MNNENIEKLKQDAIETIKNAHGFILITVDKENNLETSQRSNISPFLELGVLDFLKAEVTEYIGNVIERQKNPLLSAVKEMIEEKIAEKESKFFHKH
jgi:hypothetical protein